MAIASLADLAFTPTMIMAIVVLLMGVVFYEMRRLAAMKHRSGPQTPLPIGAHTMRRPWQELSPWMRVLLALSLIGWIVAMGSMLTVGYIETAALKQPKIADSLFTHPHDVKGIVRYFSEHQEQIYRIAKPLMIGSWAATLFLFIVYGHFEDQWEERKQQNLMDRISSYAENADRTLNKL
jgi:hypothetical protein